MELKIKLASTLLTSTGAEGVLRGHRQQSRRRIANGPRALVQGAVSAIPCGESVRPRMSGKGCYGFDAHTTLNGRTCDILLNTLGGIREVQPNHHKPFCEGATT